MSDRVKLDVSGGMVVLAIAVVGGIWGVFQLSVGGLQSSVNTVQTNVTSIDSRLQTADQKIDSTALGLRERINDIDIKQDGRFDTIQSQNTEILTQLSALEASVRTLETSLIARLDQIETAIRESGYELDFPENRPRAFQTNVPLAQSLEIPSGNITGMIVSSQTQTIVGWIPLGSGSSDSGLSSETLKQIEDPSFAMSLGHENFALGVPVGWDVETFFGNLTEPQIIPDPCLDAAFIASGLQRIRGCSESVRIGEGPRITRGGLNEALEGASFRFEVGFEDLAKDPQYAAIPDENGSMLYVVDTENSMLQGWRIGSVVTANWLGSPNTDENVGGAASYYFHGPAGYRQYGTGNLVYNDFDLQAGMARESSRDTLHTIWMQRGDPNFEDPTSSHVMGTGPVVMPWGLSEGPLDTEALFSVGSPLLECEGAINVSTDANDSVSYCISGSDQDAFATQTLGIVVRF